MVPTDFTGQIQLPILFEHIFSPLGSDFIPKTLFRADLILNGNTFSDITAAIYKIEEILNPPGLCIFCKEHNGSVYFTLSLKIEYYIDFIRYLAQTVIKMIYFRASMTS